MSIRLLARRWIPYQVRESARRRMAHDPIRKAVQALQSDDSQDRWLGEREFEILSKRYPVTGLAPPTTVFHPDKIRAIETLKRLDPASQRILDVGGGPGLVDWHLAQLGMQMVCLDLADELLPEVSAAGVRSVIGNACQIPFEDNYFDAAFSLNCFEHINDPATALAEMSRVVKPGGRIYLDFAPLYNAPIGLHAHQEIGIPFLQHLWPEQFIIARVSDKDLWHLNKWSLSDWRRLWQSFDGRLRRMSYSEQHDYNGLDLIAQFPSSFTAVSRQIEEFTTSKIVAVFEVPHV